MNQELYNSENGSRLDEYAKRILTKFNNNEFELIENETLALIDILTSETRGFFRYSAGEKERAGSWSGHKFDGEWLEIGRIKERIAKKVFELANSGLNWAIEITSKTILNAKDTEVRILLLDLIKSADYLNDSLSEKLNGTIQELNTADSISRNIAMYLANIIFSDIEIPKDLENFENIVHFSSERNQLTLARQLGLELLPQVLEEMEVPEEIKIKYMESHALKSYLILVCLNTIRQFFKNEEMIDQLNPENVLAIAVPKILKSLNRKSLKREFKPNIRYLTPIGLELQMNNSRGLHETSERDMFPSKKGYQIYAISKYGYKDYHFFGEMIGALYSPDMCFEFPFLPSFSSQLQILIQQELFKVDEYEPKSNDTIVIDINVEGVKGKRFHDIYEFKFHEPFLLLMALQIAGYCMLTKRFFESRGWDIPEEKQAVTPRQGNELNLISDNRNLHITELRIFTFTGFFNFSETIILVQNICIAIRAYQEAYHFSGNSKTRQDMDIDELKNKKVIGKIWKNFENQLEDMFVNSDYKFSLKRQWESRPKQEELDRLNLNPEEARKIKDYFWYFGKIIENEEKLQEEFKDNPEKYNNLLSVKVKKLIMDTNREVEKLNIDEL